MATRHDSKPTAEALCDQGRARYLDRPERRVPPLRAAAREKVATLWSQAVRRNSANTRVAAILWVSEKTVRAYGDPSKEKAIAVADVVAVHLAGGQVLAIGFLEDVLAFLRAQKARGLSRDEHTKALTAALGTVIVAERENDRAAYAKALRALRAKVADAITDDEGGTDGTVHSRPR